MSLRLSGTNQLSYMGVTPLQPPDLVYIERNPISGAVANADYRQFNVGTFWLNPINNTLWILVTKANNAPFWLQLGITASGFLQTLTADNAVAVTPFALNINVIGDSNITTVGSNITHSVQITLNPSISITNLNVAGNTILNNLTVNGTPTFTTLSRGVVQSTAGGVLFSSEGTNGQILISSNAGAPAWANITSGDGSVVITNGANTIDLSAAAAPGDIHFIAGNDGLTITGGTVHIVTANSTVKSLRTAANTDTIDFGESNLIIGTDPTATIVAALENVGVGVNVMNNLINGQDNVAVGFGAAQALQSGDHNIAIGQGAYLQAIDANQNIAIGALAMSGVVNNASANNTAIGNGSLIAMTNAVRNVGLGDTTLDNVTTGSNNIAVGFNAGSAITTTSDNIYLGNTGTLGDSGVTRIGTNAVQTSAFMAGVRGVVVAGPQMVTISATGQLGSQAIPGGGGSGVIIVTPFTVPGAHVWTKNADTRWMMVIVWNGGGGGGSGRQGASGSAGGGGGGAATACVQWYGSASAFGAVENVFVGSGGAGGIPQAAPNTNGNDGTSGTQSSFGTIVPFLSTNRGLGGSTGNVNGGSGAGIQYLNFGILNAPGGAASGGIGRVVNGLFGSDGTMANMLALGGSGGGGGAGADSVSERTGGPGGAILSFDNFTSELAGGAGGVESGTINGGAGNTGLTSGGVYTGGTGGGGGGGQSVGASAGTGGKGGQPGGGGGGGGGSLNGTASGAGGDGGDGMVIVVEWT